MTWLHLTLDRQYECAVTTHSLSHEASHVCKNCGATTSGNFCQQCGQATHLHVPSAREFLHEFVAHYVALEGKLWKTLALLIARPGFLTREYIQGRRARYLEPLRLYLTFSIIFFAVFKFGAIDVDRFQDPSAKPSVAVEQGKAKEASPEPSVQEQAAERDSVQKELDTGLGEVYPDVRNRLKKFSELPQSAQKAAFKQAFFSYAPYAIFALMPLFALYLKLLYLGSGRRYGEHFLFGLHTNAFAYLLLSVMILIPEGWTLVTFVLLVWLTCYLPLAMRRVYGSGRFTTLLRWSVLIFAHLLSIVLAVGVAMGHVMLT